MRHFAQPSRSLYLTAGILLLTVGCQMGPGRLKVASSHYSDALRIAESEQLLVNLVRLRYRDLPVFLAVTSLSTQFELESAFGVNGTVVSGGSNSVGIGGGVVFSERPTITFAKKGGEKFLKRMLHPIDVAVISLVAESGWRGDRLLSLTVEKINGVPNAPRASGPTPPHAPAYEDFSESLALLTRLARKGLIDFEYETQRERHSAPLAASQVDGEATVGAITAGVEFEALPDGRVQVASEKRVLVMRFRAGAARSADAARLRELLRLEPGPLRFELVALEDSDFNALEADTRSTELALDTRSVIGMFYFAANAVEVPEAHSEAGYATVTVDAAGEPFDWSRVLGKFFRVHSSDRLRRPSDAAVAVRYRGHWFYIADDDGSSKATLSLLSQLYTLQAGEVIEEKPVLTLPVGR
jgi:hypothetical protein